MGILPIVFEKSGLNEIKENIVEKKETNTLLKKNSQLFSKTIFSQNLIKIALMMINKYLYIIVYL